MTFTFLILICVGIVLLTIMEMKRSFSLLEKRTTLFLCAKESKEELQQLLKFMGRTNWGIKNLNKASMIMLFIPGLQGTSLKAQEIKKYLQYAQNLKIVQYLAILTKLTAKKCSLLPNLYQTPFFLTGGVLLRDKEGAAKLKEREWHYYYFKKPYLLELKIKTPGWESINPQIIFESREKGGKQLLPWFSSS